MRYFVVRGSGSFPFGMLRLSQAWPATNEDAKRMDLACPTVAPVQDIHFATRQELTGPIMEKWKEKKWPVERIYG